jgi:hypothetical protein
MLCIVRYTIALFHLTKNTYDATTWHNGLQKVPVPSPPFVDLLPQTSYKYLQPWVIRRLLSKASLWRSESLSTITSFLGMLLRRSASSSVENPNTACGPGLPTETKDWRSSRRQNSSTMRLKPSSLHASRSDSIQRTWTASCLGGRHVDIL